MTQSVPFRPEGVGAARVGEAAPERRQRSDAALNRAKILDAARRLLADDMDPSMSAIAEAAGLGRGTVHRHFSTRDELMDAVRRQARDDAESDEEDYLRPPGELANVSSTPLSVADILNKVPPFQLGEQIIAEAQRLPGVSSAALYVVDLDGASMQRLAGAATFPAQVTAPLAVGPEVPREGVAAIRAVFEELLPGATVAPLQLRGRAIGVLLAVGTVSDQLRDLASEAAIALALAPSYSDHIDTVRRTRQTSPAAEIQQNLLPPGSRASAARPSPATSCPDMRSAETGSITPKTPAAPGSESRTPPGPEQPPPASAPSPSGRFAPSAANRSIPPNACWPCTRCCWRSATAQPAPRPRSATGTPPPRRFAGSPPATSHRFASPPTASSSRSTATCTRAWEAPTSPTSRTPTRPALTRPNDCCSSPTASPTPTHGLGLPAIARAVAKADNNAAPATLRAIEDQLRVANPDQLDDDSTIIVLAPSGMIGPSD